MLHHLQMQMVDDKSAAAKDMDMADESQAQAQPSTSQQQSLNQISYTAVEDSSQ